MEILRLGTRPALRGNPNWFTGRVWQIPVFDAPAPSHTRALRVTFEPGARSAWHSHPLGQIVHVSSGIGLIGGRGQDPRPVRAGDTIWIPPGEEHWHGAGPDATLEHLEIHEDESGYVTTWMEYVSEEDYFGPVA